MDVRKGVYDAVAEVIINELAQKVGVRIERSATGEWTLKGTPVELLAMLREYAKD
jgi:hypothetical protein